MIGGGTAALLVQEVITDNCGENVDDDDALACVAEETIEAIDLSTYRLRHSKP